MTGLLRILMLEDNPLDVELNEYALSKGGIEFESLSVTTRREYEDALGDFRPDVILSDYELPSFDGIAAMIIAKAKCPDVPFIFVTGVMGEEMAIDTLKRGATDYVLKNRLSRLAPAVRRALDEVEALSDRRRAQEALSESERRYRAVFESTGTAMCVIDSTGVVSFANKQFEHMFGYTPRTDDSLVIYGLVSPDVGDVQEFERRHEEVLRGDGSPVVFESRVSGAGGADLTVLVTMVVLPSTSHAAISLIDLTREKEYERELSERAERLEHFMTIASHELRHPITIIKGYTTILSKRGADLGPQALADIYDTMDYAADRLTSIVEELMDVSRFEKVGLVTEKREADLETLASIAIDRIAARGFENPIEVTVAPGAGYAEVDPEKIVQLLLILLENAVNYSPAGSQVDIELTKGNGAVLLSVMDRGPGIPPEHYEKVFERFYQVADAMHHSTPGLGLGLYIARKIVAAHGGELTYEPRAGGGSVFRASLPLA